MNRASDMKGEPMDRNKAKSILEACQYELSNQTGSEWCRKKYEAIQEATKALGQPEIIHCGECVNFVERDFCKVAGHNVHRKSNCMKVFGAERRTDG